MIAKEINGLKILQSQRLLDLGVMHGWFGVSLGNTMRRPTMSAEETTLVKRRWERACGVLGMNAGQLVDTTGLLQTDTVQLLTKESAGQTVGKADGYVTSVPKMPIVMRSADCMSIIIYEPDAKVMALVHAGGRGIAGNILKSTAETMASQHADLTKAVVAIGPAIAPEHFIPTSEVDNFTLADMRSEMLVTTNLPDGRVGYDIVSTAQSKLEKLGIASNNIDISGIDTFSSPDFYSWERDRIRNPAISMYRNGLFAEIA